MTRYLGALLILLLIPVSGVAHPEGPTVGGELAAAPVAYLEIHVSTWRPRGRISFGIEPVLRMKLSAGGFIVTQDPTRTRDLTVRVEYREERGEPIGVNLYGTDITCRIMMNHAAAGGESLTIQETPSYTDLVSAPYVDVVAKLETNPYFYFLGQIVHGWYQHLDTTAALIRALDDQHTHALLRPAPTAMDTLESPAETFPDLDAHFAPSARQNTMEELGRLKDARAIEVLERLATEADRDTRLGAVVAMGNLAEPSVRPALTRVVANETDSRVRKTASELLAQLSSR